MWLAAILVGTVLVAAVVLAWVYWPPAPVPVSTGDKSALRDWEHKPKMEHTFATDAGGPMVFRVYWHESDQGFVVTLRNAGSYEPTHAVLDTGSHNLVLATTSCRDCLARHRTYHVGKSARRTGEHDTIHYASLSVDTERVIDDIGLVNAWADPVMVKDVEVHAAHSMQGTHSNVLGLASPRPASLSGRLLAMAGDGGSKRWGLALRQDGSGEWQFGGGVDPRGLVSYYSPISRGFGHAGTYVLDVEECLLVNSPSDSTVQGQHSPKYLLVDTGTPLSYTTSTCRSFFDFVMQQGSGLDIRLRGGLTLRYSPEALRDVRHDDPVLDDVLGKDSEVLLLGALMMRGMQWVFEDGRVGFAALKEA